MTGPLPPALAQISNQLIRMAERISRLERGQRTAQLDMSSIENGALTVTDADGTVRSVLGLQPDGSFAHQHFGAPAPVPPSAPQVTPVIHGLLVTWDGTLSDGSAPLSDFAGVQVHISQSPGFTPSAATLQGTLPGAGVFPLTALTPGTAYYAALVAVNTSGSLSAPSAEAAGTPDSVVAHIPPGTIQGTQIAFTARNIGGITTSVQSGAPQNPQISDLWYDGDNNFLLNQWNGSAWVPYQFGTNAIQAGSVTAALIAANTITAAQIAAGTITAAQIAANTITADVVAGAGFNVNPFFAGGSGYGWVGSRATFAVVSTVSGPYPGAGQFTCNGGSNPALETPNSASQTFGVSPGEIYMLRAWVNCSISTNVALGLNVWDSTRTFLSFAFANTAVTANTWTPVEAVVTIPASGAFAGPRTSLTGTPANGVTLAGTGILVIPPVRGGLVEAGTITAAQIAAGTITATQIAAATITAALIASHAITAAQIAAGTITATEIAAGTITAANLAAGIVVAGIVDATTITGATIIADGTSGEFLAYSGTPATGNLIASISGAAGTDGHSNPLDKGLSSYGGSGSFVNIHDNIIAIGASSSDTHPAQFGPSGGGANLISSGKASSGDTAIGMMMQSALLSISGSDEQVVIGPGTPNAVTIAMLEVQGSISASGVISQGAGANSSGSAPSPAQSLASGVASQLSDTTRDYMLYLVFSGAGNVTVAIGSTSGVGRSIVPTAAVVAGIPYSVRIPAGWFVKWTGTGSVAVASQTVVGC